MEESNDVKKENKVEGNNCLEELPSTSREREIESKRNEDDEESLLDSDEDEDFDNEIDIEGDDEIDEECAENENIDLENNEEPRGSKSRAKKLVKTITGKKRKRKGKDNTKRREIRKILEESQLEKETLTAQLEEKERLRRLELQKSLATEIVSPVTTEVPNSLSIENASHELSRSLSPMIVDFRQKPKQRSQVIVIDSDDDVSVGDQGQDDIEIISSDSVGSTSESDLDDSDIDENNVGMHSDDKYNVPNEDGKVEVNINHPVYEDDIYLAPQIAKQVKPHQIGGIRFLYDNLVETLTRYKVSSGFGCILAHSMGLGKTLQVIAFIDIFLRYTPAKKVLCVVPINTIQNWMVEFNMWLPAKPDNVDNENQDVESEEDIDKMRYRNFDVHQLGENNKTTIARAKVIGRWNQNGGVLLIGYELYRILAMSTPCMASNKCAPPKKKKSNNTSSNQEPEVIDLDEEEKNMDFLIGIQNALSKPGPDLVICDEGHRIKNNQANISQALKRMKTRRRVVLTGYPLQNNLIEYWCMVDFVRPNFLGTRHEFSNMFERPILNGQCSDSTPSDVRVMRYRAHVLHSLLEGFVQRRSQSVLKKCLPFKEEHIILVKLSSIQSQLYNSYINFLLESVGHLNPIKGFHTCTKIWNHPDVFFSSLEPKKYGSRNDSPLTLLGNDAEDVTASQDLTTPNMDPALLLSSLPQQALQQEPNSTSKSTPAGLTWAKDIMKDYQPFIAEQGGKMVILMEVVVESLNLGEKVLVFSQSLSTLSVIEDFLSRQDIPHFPGRNTENGPTKWAKNKSYFRLDGSTPSQERDRLINAFNSPDNNDVLLFILSTRAGCFGVNLIGASRVVVFDASWNPCHDVQAMCRVYRYGQKKPSHIYRLVSTGTMEKKIYDRQVSKQGVANRVVDELNPEANFTKQEIMSLICDKEPDVQADDVSSAANGFSDLVLKKICKNCSNWLAKVPFKHESLLVDKKELKLTKKEKREAKKGYEREKNMAQQGGRYNYNQTESTRIASLSSNVVKPIATAYPVQAAQPCVMTPQAFSVNMPQVPLGTNFRFASLNRNIMNPIQLRSLLPNVDVTRPTNMPPTMPFNDPVVMTPNMGIPMTTDMNNFLRSQIVFPTQSGLLTSTNQRDMMTRENCTSSHVSNSPVSLTNGSTGAMTGLSHSFPFNYRVPVVSSTQSSSQTNKVVTIDLDDLPSPPSVSSVEDGELPAQGITSTISDQMQGIVDDVSTSANHGPIIAQNAANEADSTRMESMVSMATESLNNNITGSVQVDQQPMAATVTTSTKNLSDNVNTTTAVVSLETKALSNVESPVRAVPMATEAQNDVDTSTSVPDSLKNGPIAGAVSSTYRDTTETTNTHLTLAVLQNLLNERGGLDASASIPDESPSDSPTGTPQM